MHSKFSPFILLSIYFWSFCCAQNCSEDAFNCGSIAYLSFPFWGGARTSGCGRRGCEIVCNNNTPILEIKSLSYRVEKLDFSTNTLIVARQDLQGTFCPDPLLNTTLDWDLFEYPPDSTDRNLTLYFGCTAQQPPPPNAFPCGDNTSNLFKIGDVSSSDPGNGISCYTNISVPINNHDAQSLQNPNASAVKILRSALLTGFSIQWLYSALQITAPFCNSKVYGSCSPIVRPRPCNSTNCRDSSDGGSPVPSPPTPADAPSSPGSGYGLPPAPSTGYDPQIHNDPGENRTKKIIMGVALGVAGMITVSISIHCFIKRWRSEISPNPESKHDVEGILLQWGSLTPKRYKYSEIKKITKSMADKLGEGGYGSVYKGMLPDGVPVAVKVLSDTKSNGEDFINEVASISRTSHVNIVALLGFCYEGTQRALVYEFMPNSSLDKFLNSNESAGRLDLENLYKIAVGIAKGLEYLHTGCTTRIVHFDIKPQNILLDEDFCPKISDFGLAKLCKKKQSVLSVVGMRGTIGYIAPEVFSRNFGGVSHKSDVYSYGMMILEIAGVGKAEVIRSSENYFPDRIYEQIISEVGNDLNMMEEPEERRTKMILVGFWCIQTNPMSRPSISHVLEMLEGSLESIQIPPKPFLFTPPNIPTHEDDEVSSSFVDTMENSGVDEIVTLELHS